MKGWGQEGENICSPGKKLAGRVVLPFSWAKSWAHTAGFVAG
jgi:hypothetical protein